MTESERIETLIERLKSRKGSYQWGQKIQQWLHVEERDLIVKALEHYKLSINGGHVKELNDGGLPPAMIRPLYPIPPC